MPSICALLRGRTCLILVATRRCLQKLSFCHSFKNTLKKCFVTKEERSLLRCKICLLLPHRPVKRAFVPRFLYHDPIQNERYSLSLAGHQYQRIAPLLMPSAPASGRFGLLSMAFSTWARTAAAGGMCPPTCSPWLTTTLPNRAPMEPGRGVPAKALLRGNG